MQHLLYFMHIDWGWIKQRPQFLAEALSKYYEVEVFHEKQYQAKKQKSNLQVFDHLRVNALWHLPFTRFMPIYHLNRFLVEKVFLRSKLREAQLLWMCHPLHYTGYKRAGQKLIYDCMDDTLEFDCRPQVRNQMAKQEALLCRDADLIFTSSDYLKHKLEQRYGKLNIQVVNNAISLNIHTNTALPDALTPLFAHQETKKISYIGTIASWFDFPLLLNLLDKYPNLELLLFGPSEVAIPNHDRIKYCGVVEHKYVSAIMEKTDALIMPFVVNELIKSVNPVKAYEYIYAHKPVLMPAYGEVEKFKDFIYLYHDVSEADRYFEELSAGNLQPISSKEVSQQFALTNNWENRARQIVEALEGLS